MKTFIDRHPDWLLYTLNLAVSLYLLWAARELGVLGAPQPGMDQHTMLAAAQKLASAGELPPAGYMYSPAYTALLALFALIGGGNLVAMRILQAVLCALLPVTVRNLAREFGCDRTWSFAAGLATVFYGTLQLVSLDFLRAGPLALTLSAGVLFLARGFRRKKLSDWTLAGVCGGLAVLGRETFAPAVAAPALLCLGSRFRAKLTRGAWLYPAAGAATVLTVVIFNGLTRDGWAIVPGHYGNVMECYYGVNSPWHAMLRGLPERIGELFGAVEITNSLSVYAHRELLPFLRILAIPANLLWGVGLLGIGYGWKRPAVRMAALVLAGGAAALLLFPVFYRFRIPLTPLLAALAATGAAGLVRAFRSGMRPARLRATAAAVFAAGFALVFWNDPAPYRTDSERRAVVVILLRNERYAAAGELLDALERDKIPCERLRLYWRRKNGVNP